MTANRLRVVEIGSYISVAYAGMVLAEQGAAVYKVRNPQPVNDPIEDLRKGAELWRWINHNKIMITHDARDVAGLLTTMRRDGRVHVVLDNIRADTWAAWGVDIPDLARRFGVTWVSMRADDDRRSFDAIAQARAWGDHIGVQAAYLGDTSFGLWAAFKAMAAEPGHHVLRQAACLAKLVEGELVVPIERDGINTPWDEEGQYGVETAPNGDIQARVIFRGETIREPMRDDEWRRDNLKHDRTGRYRI